MQIAPTLNVLRALGSSPSPSAPTRPGSCGAPCGSEREHLAEVHAVAAAQALAVAPRAEVRPAGAAHTYGRAGPPEASKPATWVSRPRVDILV